MGLGSQNIESLSPLQKFASDFLRYLNQNNLAEAEKVALAVSKTHPEEQIGWKMLGAVLAQMGRLAEALEPMRVAVTLAPNDAEAHDNLGAVQLQLGLVTKAVLSHKSAIALQPTNAVSYFNLGNALQAQGQLEAAEKNFRNSISLAPDSARTHYNLACLLREMGRLKQAEFSYTKAIELAPEYTAAVTGRWQVLFEQGDFEKALLDAESINTETLRASALETLFALGRHEEVRRRLFEQEATEIKNLRVAAFSSFFSAHTKTSVPTHFCANPLEYLCVTNISNHVKDPEIFLSKLINQLSTYEVIWEPHGKATKGGYQTPPSTNLFDEPSGGLLRLKELIALEIGNYLKIFEDKPCGFIQSWPSQADLSAWFVCLSRQGYQESHIHPDGWLSGVIYLKVVSNPKNDEGAIEFGLNGPRYTDPNLPTVVHKPAPGDVVLFPSSLHHKTIPFSIQSERLIVSFDLIPRHAP